MVSPYKLLTIGAILDAISLLMLNMNGIFTNTWLTCAIYGAICSLWVYGCLCASRDES